MAQSSTSQLISYLDLFKSLFNRLLALVHLIPGSHILLRYVRSSHQNDPFRTLLELLLVFFVIRTWRQNRTRGDHGLSQSFVKLSEKEIDELVSEWNPEPLVNPAPPSTQALSHPPIILGIPHCHPKILHGNPAHQFTNSTQYQSNIDPSHIRSVINLASINFAGLIGEERVKLAAIQQLRRSGVGSCGPPGFYGTFDVHMELERDIAQFIGLPSSIIYAQGFSTTSSVIPAFSKRGDIIVVDRGVNFSIQKGIQLSRSTIRWYDHNDYVSLEKVLEQLRLEEITFRRKLTRKFIITEGLFESDGKLCDLPKIIELKQKYKFRLVLDETWSIGSVGRSGKGVTEYFNVPAGSVDILVGSLATSFNSGGGFCAGSKEVISHQRINSAALVFSAALPPLLATAASETIKILSEPEGKWRFEKLRANTQAFRQAMEELVQEGLISIPSDRDSPLIHITLALSPLSATGSSATPNLPLNLTRFEEQETLLQAIVDRSIEECEVLITRTKKVWEEEIDPMPPSIRICLSSGLDLEEVQTSAQKLVNLLREVLLARANQVS